MTTGGSSEPVSWSWKKVCKIKHFKTATLSFTKPHRENQSIETRAWTKSVKVIYFILFLFFSLWAEITDVLQGLVFYRVLFSPLSTSAASRAVDMRLIKTGRFGNQSTNGRAGCCLQGEGGGRQRFYGCRTNLLTPGIKTSLTHSLSLSLSLTHTLSHTHTKCSNFVLRNLTRLFSKSEKKRWTTQGEFFLIFIFINPSFFQHITHLNDFIFLVKAALQFHCD